MKTEFFSPTTLFPPHRMALALCAVISAVLVSSVGADESFLETPPIDAEPYFPSDNPEFLGGSGSVDSIPLERQGGAEEKDEDDQPRKIRPVVYDVATKTVRVLNRSYDDGIDEPPRSVADRDPPCAQERKSGEAGGASVFGNDGRTEITDTTVTPWNRIGKIYAWFHDPATDPASATTQIEINNADCVGTGALVGPCHVLTAGHVIYNQDPLCGAIGWAQKIVFVPGLYTDGSGVVRWPFGSHYATRTMSWEGWTLRADEDEDMGFFVLDEAVGNTTGWFGYSTADSDGATRNISGYPADRSNGLEQYWMDGEIKCENSYNLKYKIDTAGGQSGAPIWRYTGTNRYIHGVHASGNVPLGCWFETENRGTRITSGKFDAIQNWKADYECPEPESDLGDDGGSGSDLPERTFTLHPIEWPFVVRNFGVRPASGFRVRLYLSGDDKITPQDHFLGEGEVPAGLACFEPVVVDIQGRVPADVEPGLYYVGWVIDPGENVRESNELNNIGVVSRKIEVRRRPIRYRRGDTNEDGQFDLSDSIKLLDHLYLGKRPPRCLRTADTNNDGTLDLSDILTSLNALFSRTKGIGGPTLNVCDDDVESPSRLSCTAYSHCGN